MLIILCVTQCLNVALHHFLLLFNLLQIKQLYIILTLKVLVATIDAQWEEMGM